ncbi:hypothetical protein ACTFIZ_008948 [Dictyostelium cf. discoideum]
MTNPGKTFIIVKSSSFGSFRYGPISTNQSKSDGLNRTNNHYFKMNLLKRKTDKMNPSTSTTDTMSIGLPYGPNRQNTLPSNEPKNSGKSGKISQLSKQLNI